MKSLSSLLSSELIEALKKDIHLFEGLTFKSAMDFILTDGLMPADHLNVHSLIQLQNWILDFERAQNKTFTTTELKNKTGAILTEVSKGRTVYLEKHGKIIAEIRRVT